MSLGVKIPKHKQESITDSILNGINPKMVYIPLAIGNNTDITALVNKGDFVYKGSLIGKSKGDFRLPIYSSVSGKVMDITLKRYQNGEMVKCVQIENDFQERTEEWKGIKKDISNLSKTDFVELLRKCGILGMGGSGFPTYVKYDTDSLHTLIVNAVECEPFITADNMLLKEKCEEILETMDAIMNIYHMKEGILAIKTGNEALKRIIKNYIGTYINIRLFEIKDAYPMGWERSLIKEATGKDYQNRPTEIGIVVNNLSTIYTIGEALRKETVVTERVVTMSGELFKKPQNVRVKIGTPLKDIIEAIGGYKRNKEVLLIAGGPMMGTSLIDEDLVISPTLGCVLALKPSKKTVEGNCMRCGKCAQVCPVKLTPVLIKDAAYDIEHLKHMQVKKCIGCGLCSYICPAKINVREYVKQAKGKVG